MKEPWGKPSPDGPPDLLDVFSRFFGPSGKKQGGGRPGFLLLGFLGILLLWVLSGIFVVEPAEQAVVTRFGRFVNVEGPGPHWIPAIVSRAIKLNVQKINNFSYQADMLTQDENIVLVSLAVQFRIEDPKAFLFDVSDPIITLRQATSSALRQVVGHMTLDAVLTKGREQLRAMVEQQLVETLTPYSTGISIVDVNLQPAKPPEPVTHAFDDAIKAREDEQRYVNEAQAYARKVGLMAQGEISRIKQSAAAYKESVVAQAKGKVARFAALMQAYQKNQQVTAERLYLDAVTHVLQNTTNVLVDSSGSNMLYLPFDQLIKNHRKLTEAADESTRVEATEALPQLPTEQQLDPQVSSYHRGGYTRDAQGGQS